MRRYSRLTTLAVAAVAIVAIAVPMTVLANGGSGGKLRAEPWIFVGTAAQCGGPAGSRIVTSAWLGGMGLPDNGGDTALNAAPNTARDPHRGLLLSKNGPQSNCSSAGATIHGVKGIIVDADFALGFDYRNGGHCGAGAPRFNVEFAPPTGPDGSIFVGCANAPQAGAPQDLAEWTRTRSVLITCGIECFPTGVPLGSKIKSIDIVFDEGTDIASNDTQGVGLAVIDNIFIDGRYIRSGSGIEPDGGGRQDNDHGGDGDDD